VTSAAAIWMLAALGALIGMDMLHQALLLTVVTLSILVGVDYLEASFKSLRRGVHNRLEHWRHGPSPRSLPTRTIWAAASRSKPPP
jgi:putative Mg2+ transporter-C (MgtC) family protein